ncbi:MAG TPA: hypothetical protein VEF53_18795 [Patescibacteria group bacterium]|nr:hypothetical protein [Patescibacteria group bacterium]
MQFNNSSISIGDTDIIEAKFEPLKDNGTITIIDKNYCSITFEMSREQAENLYKSIDNQLYDESYVKMEDRLTRQIIALETKLEEVKGQLELATMTPAERCGF